MTLSELKELEKSLTPKPWGSLVLDTKQNHVLISGPVGAEQPLVCVLGASVNALESAANLAMARNALPALITRLEEAEAVLRYYAKESNWEIPDGEYHLDVAEIADDEGDFARAHLEKWRNS